MNCAVQKVDTNVLLHMWIQGDGRVVNTWVYKDKMHWGKNQKTMICPRHRVLNQLISQSVGLCILPLTCGIFAYSIQAYVLCHECVMDSYISGIKGQYDSVRAESVQRKLVESWSSKTFTVFPTAWNLIYAHDSECSDDPRSKAEELSSPWCPSRSKHRLTMSRIKKLRPHFPNQSPLPEML